MSAMEGETMSRERSTELKPYARKLRKEMTKEERKLWYQCLKQLPVNVYKQKPIGDYIVDFYCAGAKLVIELDGSQHYEDSGTAKDRIRDEYLQGLGLTVVRYSNADVNYRFDAVCEDVRKRIFG